MSFYLAVEGSYRNFHIALFKKNDCLDNIVESEESASSSLTCKINQILFQNQMKLQDLSFISVNCGPGAFTSLRTVITVLNGVSFGAKINLVAVDGLDALAMDSYKLATKKFGVTSTEDKLFVPVLNAYSGECYYSIYKPSENREKAVCRIIDCKYAKTDQIFEEISILFPKGKIYFSGNGLDIYKDDFAKGMMIIGSSRCYKLPIKCCSTEQVGSIGFSLWKKGIYCKEVEPFYLKSQI